VLDLIFLKKNTKKHLYPLLLKVPPNNKTRYTDAPHSIKVLLDLPELHIIQVQQQANQVFIDVTPVAYTQPCPICASTEIIRRGTAYQRKVRHLDAFDRCVYLMMPAIRMICTSCQYHFNWVYDCVAPKKRYTKAFEASLPKKAMGQRLFIRRE